ncbi:MAG: LssY C-terminal domain-containing protein, partial [Planctomycetota bacterium]
PLLRSLSARLWRLVITPYEPDLQFDAFMQRSLTQENPQARATVAVLATDESRRLFGVDVARRGMQPVFLRIENRSADPLRLQMVSIDPRYFTPLEAAGVNHFSVLRRLSAFGVMGWLFVPLLALVPLKLITAYLANGRMDDAFKLRGFPLKPVPPGATAQGFVFTSLDLGTKAVHVRLITVGSIRQTIGRILPSAGAHAAAGDAPPATVDFLFTVPVPGISADYHAQDFETIRPAATVEPCDIDALVTRLEALPPATTNAVASRSGDPVNLVLIGEFATILSAFAARWDESETISWLTCWKTVRAFLWGSNYRYSPVSDLHLFGRHQDLALQRTRRSINERLHLRLWLTPLAFADKPVWVGQVSRDIGVRFTTRAWNLTTHRIDPNVDESRDYVIEDLVQAQRVEAAGYVGGAGECLPGAPRHNLTGDPYYTDGKRAVILVAPTRTP